MPRKKVASSKREAQRIRTWNKLDSWKFAELPDSVRELVLKPIEGGGANTRRFKLFVFLVGNGTSPYRAATMIKLLGAKSDKSVRHLAQMRKQIGPLLASNKSYYWDMRIGGTVRGGAKK
jgi:hypothetical protein